MILSHLSIADLQNLRAAGLGSVSIASRKRLHVVMKRRVKSVQALWRIWRRSREERYKFSPVQFTSTITKLNIAPDVDGVPESICEMKKLRTLDISRSPRSATLNVTPPLTTLPKSLTQLQGLLELRMSQHSFEYIPACVLQLKMLRRIEVEYNPNLKEIPAEIGDELIHLRFMSIRWCGKVKKLPESLLRRLEVNVRTGRRHRVPLLVTEDQGYFDESYLADTITRDKYPELARYREGGALTGGGLGLGIDHEIFLMDNNLI